MKRLACCVMAMVLLAAMLPVFGNAAAYGEEGLCRRQLYDGKRL